MLGVWWLIQLKTGVLVRGADSSREFGDSNYCIIDVLMMNSKSKSPIHDIFLHLGSFYSDNFSRFSRKIVGLFPIFKNIKNRRLFHNLLIKTGTKSVKD